MQDRAFFCFVNQILINISRAQNKCDWSLLESFRAYRAVTNVSKYANFYTILKLILRICDNQNLILTSLNCNIKCVFNDKREVFNE